MKLTRQQEDAVMHLGSPALVVAGAGSGKTRTLTAKIAHLIDSGHRPERILAITFTNKAADEMKRRLVDMTGFSEFRFPWVRTYHSACLQILKRHFDRLGFVSAPQIYQPHQQEKIVKDILIGLDIDKKHTRSVLYQISLAKNSADPMGYFQDTATVAYVPLHEIYARYEAELKARTAVDFDNILLLTRDLLRRHEDVRNRYQALFTYVLVDEYQDTNNLQEELTGLLTKDGHLFCVGDDWQAIYSFRGSNIGHFLAFREKYAGARLFRLEQNFRSADEIVQVANQVIRFNENRVDKACFSDRQGGVVELHDFFDETEEAQWVAAKLQVLRETGVPYRRMAVLYRTKFCSLAFEQMFRACQIPYQMLGGKGFFDRKEILDLVGYLNVAQFEKDDVSFERIVNIPKRGIGPGTLKKIAAFKRGDTGLLAAARKALHEKVLTPKLYRSLGELIRLIDDIQTMPPDAALQTVIERVGYMDYLENSVSKTPGDMTARRENIDQLVYAAAQKDTLIDFLEEAALIRDDREESEEEKRRGVKLSTIHAAKGLEYYAVFVIGCEERLFPHWKSMETPTELEEERRLMYVSMTRAEQFLYLTSADYRRGQYNPQSRFLGEIAESIDR